MKQEDKGKERWSISREATTIARREKNKSKKKIDNRQQAIAFREGMKAHGSEEGKDACFCQPAAVAPSPSCARVESR